MHTCIVKPVYSTAFDGVSLLASSAEKQDQISASQSSVQEIGLIGGLLQKQTSDLKCWKNTFFLLYVRTSAVLIHKD